MKAGSNRYNLAMTRWVPIFLLLACSLARAGGDSPDVPCSEEWNRFVEQRVISGDGQGHGPDLGSEEWKGVVEFKLGIRGQPGVPARDSDEWCSYIDGLVRGL